MVEEISPAELRDRLADGDEIQIVDVRPTESFDRGHIPGAENVPLSRLVEEIDEREWHEFVVAVCPHGESSLQAARLIESYEGVPGDATVANLAGGLAEWDYELETHEQ